ncbi:MAG: heavy metal-associated domain-containing protein [Oscillospiraceae bacterium]|nr:cation transporter [Oscillospiraceae bacterium]MDD6083535.1 heavy metal-associated domain-containing protein [Oscillospiraceae bacterium]
MLKITVDIEGMMCNMCESHMDDEFKKQFSFIKKVTSSHSENNSVIITTEDIDDERLKAAVEECGYKFLGAARVPYEKKGLFSFGSR